MRRWKSQNDSRRRGSALVEMAMVLPIFMLIVLAIVEFGRGMMASAVLTQASREGARVGCLAEKTNADVTTHVKDFVASALQVAPGDVQVSITVTEAAGNPSAGNDVANANSDDLITVEVQVPFNKVAYTAGEFLKDKQLVVESVMRHE